MRSGPTFADANDAGAAPAHEGAFFVYGIVPAGAGRPAEGLAGLDGAPVLSFTHGEVAAVVGEIGLERAPKSRADLLAYSQVLDALAASGAVIPVQFGSVLADRQSLVEDLLAPNEGYFAELLAQLEDRAQFNVRARYVEHVVLGEVRAADPEIARLSARTREAPEDAAYGERVRLGELVARAMEVKREGDADLLVEAVAPFVSAHVARLGSGVDRLLDLAVLVDDERRDAFEAQLEDLAEAVHERIHLSLVGPVAPYDFVGDAGWV